MSPVARRLKSILGFLELGMIAEARQELVGIEDQVSDESLWMPYSLLMCIFKAEGNRTEAEIAARWLLEHQPNEPRWRIALAQVLSGLPEEPGSPEECAEALTVLQDAEAEFPGAAPVKYELARLLARTPTLTGQAAGYLRAAFALDGALRREARNDLELESLWPLLAEL